MICAWFAFVRAWSKRSRRFARLKATTSTIDSAWMLSCSPVRTTKARPVFLGMITSSTSVIRVLLVRVVIQSRSSLPIQAPPPCQAGGRHSRQCQGVPHGRLVGRDDGLLEVPLEALEDVERVERRAG